MLYGKFPEEMAPKTLEGSEIKTQIERFLLQKKAEIKASTVQRYAIQFKAIERFLATQRIEMFSQLNSGVVKDFKFFRLNEGKSHKTVAEELSIFRSMIRGLIAVELLEKDPVRIWPEVKKRIPAKPDTLGPYSDLEVKALLEYFKTDNPDFYPVALMAFYTGMRSGEIKGLKVSDINFVDAVATVYNQKSVKDTKSAYRKVTLHPELLAILKKRCKLALPNAYAFPELRLHAPHWTVRQIEKSCKLLGIQYRRFHGCRHTFATKAANSGIALPKVQSQLGHTNMSTTQRYIRKDPMDDIDIRLVDFG